MRETESRENSRSLANRMIQIVQEAVRPSGLLFPLTVILIMVLIARFDVDTLIFSIMYAPYFLMDLVGIPLHWQASGPSWLFLIPALTIATILYIGLVRKGKSQLRALWFGLSLSVIIIHATGIVLLFVWTWYLFMNW